MGFAFALSSSVALGSAKPYADCVNAAYSEARFEPLLNKLSLKEISNIPFAQLADSTRATPAERRIILALFAERDRCWKSSEAYVQTWTPETAQLVRDGLATIRTIGLDLYGGKTTFGEANTRLQSLAAEVIAKTVKIQAERDAQKAAQSAETKQKQAATDLLAAQQRTRDIDRQIAQQEVENARVEAKRLAREQEWANAALLVGQSFQQIGARPQSMYAPPPTGLHCTSQVVNNQTIWTNCN